MAEAWAGFSQEELRRLRGQRPDLYEPSPPQQQQQQPRPQAVPKPRKQLQREKALQQQSQRLGLQGGAASVTPEQLLSAPQGKPCDPQQPGPAPGDERQRDSREQQEGVAASESCNGRDSAQPRPAKANSQVERKKVELSRQEKSRWEILQQEQRLIEEKNKRKKALLARAIAERSKRTQAETAKLKRIQKELQALDDMVSADIGILRNRIDQASLDYSYARKRYDKAESEYVAAKLDLQHKTEIKEHLTEHLCTIIQQNELRKARKLQELMQQLDVEADEENLELEIEVEQMLQQQEAEAGRQSSQAQSHAGTAQENPAATGVGQESQQADRAAAASPAVSEQSQKPRTKSLSNVDSQTQAVNVTSGSSPACSAT